MPRIDRDGAEIDWQSDGPDGAVPLVMVHGSWSDRSDFAPIVPLLAGPFRVVTYDRRGHGTSTEAAPGTAEDDVGDLAAVIRAQGSGPVCLYGHSFGAVLSLKLAASDPGLIDRLAIHEPPLVALLDPDSPLMARIREAVGGVIEKALAGAHEEAARHFIDVLVYEPGTFDALPAPVRAMLTANTGTFIGEMQDPQGTHVDLAALAGFGRPALISRGALSPELFQTCADMVETALPGARRERIEGAGHAPHATHSGEFASLLAGFFEN